MNINEAILKRRTIRKFTQKPIDDSILSELVNAARLAPTAANMQPLKFAVIKDKKLLDDIFPLTKWAGYLPDGAPKDGERPAAYIAILGDMSIKKEFQVDAGAAAASITLAAMGHSLGSCWLGAIKRDEITDVLALDKSRFSLLYLVALGYPAQESDTVDISDNDVKYFEDESGKIHVPKRPLDEVLILNK